MSFGRAWPHASHSGLLVCCGQVQAGLQATESSVGLGLHGGSRLEGDAGCSLGARLVWWLEYPQ